VYFALVKWGKFSKNSDKIYVISEFCALPGISGKGDWGSGGIEPPGARGGAPPFCEGVKILLENTEIIG
jgi:hypothetical protein